MQASRSVDGARGRDAFRNARNTAPGFNSRDIASWLS